jgi:hypothetical protein
MSEMFKPSQRRKISRSNDDEEIKSTNARQVLLPDVLKRVRLDGDDAASVGVGGRILSENAFKMLGVVDGVDVDDAKELIADEPSL